MRRIRQTQRGCQASGRVVSLRTWAGIRPLISSARLTSSTTSRTAARTATQRFGRFSAAPVYRVSSGRSPRHAGQRTVDRAQDLPDGHVPRRLGQRVAALGAALGADHAGPAQVGEHRLEELAGHVLVLGDGLGGHQRRVGLGQAQGGPDRVVAARGDLHPPIMPRRRAAGTPTPRSMGI